jgi:trehalose-phosphatase
LARRPPSRKQIPQPLPPGMLADLARSSGLGLFLDYDGTLAEIVKDPKQAVPLAGVPELLARLISSNLPITIAIVTGRRISQVKRFLGTIPGILFSGVHGMEFEDADGKTSFAPAALKCLAELTEVRKWVADHIADKQGFRIEDKEIAIGLHYRDADPDQASELVASFEQFVAASTKHLKLMHLKMLAEAMPRTAGNKGRTVTKLKQQLPTSHKAVYLGDDTTDEDAFKALGPEGVTVLVGAERPSYARFRVAGPVSVRHELEELAGLIRS